MKEEENVDNKELVKQYYEKALETEQYIEVKAIITRDMEYALPYIKVRGVGVEEVACMIKTLKFLRKELEKQYPKAKHYSKFMKVDTEEI